MDKFTVREVVLSAKRLLGEGTEWAKTRRSERGRRCVENHSKKSRPQG